MHMDFETFERIMLDVIEEVNYQNDYMDLIRRYKREGIPSYPDGLIGSALLAVSHCFPRQEFVNQALFAYVYCEDPHKPRRLNVVIEGKKVTIESLESLYYLINSDISAPEPSILDI